MRPPCASAMRREIDRPSPTPGRSRAEAPRRKGSKIRSRSSRSTPIPSSDTASTARSPSRAAETTTFPPAGEYLIAFESRLFSTWATRAGSHLARSGSDGACSSTAWRGLASSKSSTASRARSRRSHSATESATRPASIRDASRKSSSSRSRRATCRPSTSTVWRIRSSGGSGRSGRTRASATLSAASGLRRSWATAATKASWSSRCRSSPSAIWLNVAANARSSAGPSAAARADRSPRP